MTDILTQTKIQTKTQTKTYTYLREKPIVEYITSFKAMIIGDTNVGKSSLLGRMMTDTYTDRATYTIGADCSHLYFKDDKICYTMNVWDMSGRDQFKSIVSFYYRGACAAMLVFDLCNHTSFEYLFSWLEDISSNLIPIILVGNKSDDLNNIQVTDDEVEEFINSALNENIKFIYIKTSAKTGDNVEHSFNVLFTEGLKIKQINDNGSNYNGSIVLKDKCIYNDDNINNKCHRC